LIVWGPGIIQNKVGTANTTSFFAAIDLVPSLLKLAGVPKPADVEFDGEALPDVLVGVSDASRQMPLYFRRPPDRPKHNGEGDLPDLAVRDRNWKLLCEYDGSNPQLYNLETDPGESSNIAKANPQLVERLTALVLEWNRSMPADKGATYAALGKTNGKGRNVLKQRK
jgi:uncharacterized sulfatase